MQTIYLDNAATTFPKPGIVYDQMDSINRTLSVNTGRGSYRLAREAAEIIETTKKKILKIVNGQETSTVIFSPSVTIAMNQILQGIDWDARAIVYVSPYEHNAVARTVRFLQKKYHFSVIELPLISDSLEIDIDKMIYQFSKEKPTCICLNAISNVTGYILPIKKIFEEAKKYNAITLLDAAQALGLIKININDLQADCIAFAGHKTLYGPFGIGGFIKKNEFFLNEFLVGGTGSNSLSVDMPAKEPDKYESASSNIVAIAGLDAALSVLNQEELYRKEKEITEYLVNQLSMINKVKVFMPSNKDHHIGIVSFVIEGFSSEDIGMILDEDFNICVRTGYHCAPYIHKYLNDESYLGTIRIGLGQFNTKKDIDKLVDAINDIVR